MMGIHIEPPITTDTGRSFGVIPVQYAMIRRLEKEVQTRSRLEVLHRKYEEELTHLRLQLKDEKDLSAEVSSLVLVSLAHAFDRCVGSRLL